MTKENFFSDHLFHLAEEQTINTAQKAKELKAQAEEAANIQKLWEDITTFMQHGWLFHILDIMDKQDLLLKKMKVDNHPTISYLEEIYQFTQEQATKIKPYNFPRDLQNACDAANLPLDRDSAHPNYKFENGFFQLHINDQKRTARLGNYESAKLWELPADIEAIVEAIKREHKRVFGREFDPKAFLKKLRKQYLEIIKKDKFSDGSSIPVRHITRQLSRNEKGFRTDEFLIDLSRLVEKGLIEIGGVRLELQHTKDTNQGLLLHIETKRYIGFILFNKI
ncbi:hypothetical protein NIES37_70880 (plasmid) [Tolypothrix tenuis PCC 7101]|uniref:Uncharacterized protein n=1 Tax=Tolypothrix tenuis PCC 7101 TaxID=231146 RepID=A0A1Z4NBL2_9CYAN|nr:hypothetical protein [Aulosira sp. FACHB-113]BAZ03075.1 hypothetical protein NIES37_70880 [Tolypothrix tenuis PCC 7101]BAZ78461.1 hypothetical protein NIES50_70940 [Aulosira laxa NIES-50]